MKLTNFIQQFKTINIASADKSSTPQINYTPFVFDDNSFYISLSRLAKHTLNLSINPRVSLMLIEDESNSENIFSRDRLTLNCKVKEIKQDTNESNLVIELFEYKFKNISNVYRDFKDFRIFKLSPIDGIFILGFGKAYSIDSELNILNYLKSEMW